MFVLVWDVGEHPGEELFNLNAFECIAVDEKDGTACISFYEDTFDNPRLIWKPWPFMEPVGGSDKQPLTKEDIYVIVKEVYNQFICSVGKDEPLFNFDVSERNVKQHLPEYRKRYL